MLACCQAMELDWRIEDVDASCYVTPSIADGPRWLPYQAVNPVVTVIVLVRPFLFLSFAFFLFCVTVLVGFCTLDTNLDICGKRQTQLSNYPHQTDLVGKFVKFFWGRGNGKWHRLLWMVPPTSGDFGL